MILLGIGMLGLAAYVVFDHYYPNPKSQVKDLDMSGDIVYGQNHIKKQTKGHKVKNWVVFHFSCRIVPVQARMSDHKTVIPMRVPKEYIIRSFSVGVNSDGTVEFVRLGPDQYHADNDPRSNCLVLQHLYRAKFDSLFLERLIDLMSVYDVETSMRHDHWDNEDFRRSNKPILEATADLIS